MPLYVCSLVATDPQTIPPGGYHLLRFPFGAAESYDAWGMHQAFHDGPVNYEITNWAADDRSGLIWPSASGWGALTGVIYWQPGNYTELRDEFVRDPLGFGTDPNNRTGVVHRPPSPGMQCFEKHHEIFVRPDVPLGLRVGHNDSTARWVTRAEFKLAIHTDVAAPN